MAAVQEYYIWVPLRDSHLSRHFFWNYPRTSVGKKSYFLVIFIKKNHELYVGFLFSRGYKFPGKTGNTIVFPGIPGNSREITLFTFKQNYTQSTNLLTLKIT